jgi:hypothetical protein
MHGIIHIMQAARDLVQYKILPTHQRAATRNLLLFMFHRRCIHHDSYEGFRGMGALQVRSGGKHLSYI